MRSAGLRRPLARVGVALLSTLALCALSAGSADAATGRGTDHGGTDHGGGVRLYVPPPDPGAITQIKGLLRSHKVADAFRVGTMVTTPQAVWLTKGTPAQVRREVRKTMEAAQEQRAVPVFVAYNLPFRDCSQYSSGGAADTSAYLSWIDGLVAGIGNRTAIVLLEPDSLGIIPFNTDINGNKEWCQPKDAAGNPQPGANPEQRYLALNGAVDRLTRNAKTSVYLDGTNSHWLSVGDAANRLMLAGVQRTKGFFQNVSNYRTTSDSTQYATWISECIAFANNPDDGGWRLGHYSYCASEYYPASPDDPSTWHLSDEWYAANLGNAKPSTHFVIDTSRNGRGPNDMSAYAAAPYNQPSAVVDALRAANWCNPPGAGTGPLPTMTTGVPLLDAYFWVKTPGQSDGSCDIAGGARAWDYSAYNPWKLTGSATDHFDPLWGMVDPDAGAWFPAQALELAQKAKP